MFIKKDLRKIPRILDDAPECQPLVTKSTPMDTGDDEESNKHRDKRMKSEQALSELRLGRRHQEFQGSLQILCQPKYIPKLQQLQSLNLYDCGISNLDDIGVLAECPTLELLNLGRNPIQEISSGLAKVQSLKHIWLDDCKISGSLPSPLLELANLETLRMPNNNITDIVGISKLSELKLLCLDRNQLSHLPDELGLLIKLEELFLRHNQLTVLPRACFAGLHSLQLLHVSSNKLIDWNGLIGCNSLTHIYANGNQLTSVPKELLENLESSLRRLVISHNPIKNVPDIFWKMNDKEDCEIVWKPNPNLSPPQEDVDMTPATTE